MSALDDALLDAHARSDQPALVALYVDAADDAARRGDTGAIAFYLTHAYVFALDCGDSRASELHASLREMGREE